MDEPHVAGDGIPASRFQLPAGDWTTVLDCLCDAFPRIDQATWRSRFARGRVLDAGGRPLHADAPYRVGLEVRYFREVEDEPAIAAGEGIVHLDEHLLVADKPHGLAVAPTGRFVAGTLLVRLRRRTGLADLVPLHRIDRGTAGLVLFSVRRESRAAYQRLFADRRIEKTYEALAPALPGHAFPLLRRSRLERGEPFFAMREVEGEPNSESWIGVLDAVAGSPTWRYALRPVTGRKHQLRVHMAALGAPILGDTVYPRVREAGDEPPLQLLARSLRFDDPIDGRERCFDSRLRLQALRPTPARAG